jgi:hypothetical protein
MSDPLESLRKIVKKWRKDATIPCCDSGTGYYMGCRCVGLTDCADDIAAVLPALEEAMAAERDAARGQALRFAVEIGWWHRQWHRDTGIPCDGTMEVCKRHEISRTSAMPGLTEHDQQVCDATSGEALLNFVDEMLHGKFGILSRETERTMVYIKQRLKVETALDPSAVKAAEPISEALRDCRDRAAEPNLEK